MRLEQQSHHGRGHSQLEGHNDYKSPYYKALKEMNKDQYKTPQPKQSYKISQVVDPDFKHKFSINDNEAVITLKKSDIQLKSSLGNNKGRISRSQMP